MKTFFAVLAIVWSSFIGWPISLVDGCQINQKSTPLQPVTLRCEYRINPLGIDEAHPRLDWKFVSTQRGQKQTAYRLLVASTAQRLADEEGDLWDSGKVESAETIQIEYGGAALTSRQSCFWKVKSWNRDGVASSWSEPAFWSMGLLDESDWSANYISFRDTTPVFTDRKSLYLPPARQYRTKFNALKKIKRATVYATGLGIYELELNGRRVSEDYFAPGWTDYRQRAYYNTYDVTEMIQAGENAVGATVAEGWYSGYVGFGLLVGIGTEQIGRYTYGKTPSVMVQLEIEFDDGTLQTIVTDKSWKVTDDGPVREADLLMGEAYDARKELAGWSLPGYDDRQWQTAILATENGSQPATFFEFNNPDSGAPKIKGRPVDLAFNRPRLESFPGVPVVVTQELKPIQVTQRDSGTYIFDLGQNFAGNIRLKLNGPAGHQVTIRYAEMLHPDGSMMTENLRKARSTDTYTCSGDPAGEIFSPRFTCHGFQFVEVSNFPGEPAADAVTGLAIHSDTPMTSTFECSDPMVNQLFSNVVWTQRSNFIDLPTDCPQRDERMGWTGDAQAYVATAAYNADIGAFFTKWNRELMESQRPSGAFPGYAPYPFQHGWDFGSAWADAGVICPYTIWQVYGDTRMIDRCWEPMTKFMQWRKETSVDELGISHGNAWGDWLSQGQTTPLDFVDSVYFAYSTSLMASMAEATGRHNEAVAYQEQFDRTKRAFIAKYVRDDGSLTVTTQTAHALALSADLIPAELREKTGQKLADLLLENGNHMATGFLGTKPLLPVLTDTGQNDLATFLLQSHEFPSWGYEIDQGATSIWERWDSYTKEDGFGRHNAAMNSFSHYSFGAVCEWMFRSLAGIESDGPGYKKIIIHPHPPRSQSNAMHEPIDWVKASYDSIRGTIVSQWKLDGDQFHLQVVIPANTTATIFIPAKNAESIMENGQALAQCQFVNVLRQENGLVVCEVESGEYQFVSQHGIAPPELALKTSQPPDRSFNPDNIDLSTAQKLKSWNFSDSGDREKWSERNNLEIDQREAKTYLVASGDDPQLAITLDEALTGMLVLELKIAPVEGATTTIFWANPGKGFNGSQRVQRKLNSNDAIGSYLFRVGDKEPLKKIRLDPLLGSGEVMIESVSIFRLQDWQVESEAKEKKGEDESESEPNAEKKNEEQPANTKSSFEIPVEPSSFVSLTSHVAADEKGDADARSKQPDDRPNILFVLTEDQGAHLSLLKTAGLETPHIDALAKSGMYFNKAFVVYPVCSASKAAMYTGLHCHTNGILNNTHNYHKPAEKLTAQERDAPLYLSNRIGPEFLTLTEILNANGYYQGVTHKLHVAPVEKFPYDEFLHGSRKQLDQFLENASQSNQPWFLLVNLPNSHRPYPNSDDQAIGVDPADVQLPQYLPDTPVIRQDWSEYLAGIEAADALTGQALNAVKDAGQYENTIVVFMSDHGPTYPHGKMTLHDLGLRVPLIIRGPGVSSGKVTNELVTELDLLPTLLEMIQSGNQSPLVMPAVTESSINSTSTNSKSTKSIPLSLPYRLHGKSIVDLLQNKPSAKGHDYVFAEISNRGVLPNEGIQERSVFDGRWKLIYRENVDKAWRQVNDDTRMFKTWGNRTYRETIRLKDQYPQAFRILQEMDPQNLSGTVPPLELYDLQSDPDEMQNLADQPEITQIQNRLLNQLQNWAKRTGDVSTQLKSLEK